MEILAIILGLNFAFGLAWCGVQIAAKFDDLDGTTFGMVLFAIATMIIGLWHVIASAMVM